MVNMKNSNTIEAHQLLLTKQLLGKKLPHALIIHGVTGSGKQELATWLVRSLLCANLELRSQNETAIPCGKCKECMLFLSGAYPDTKYIASEGKTIGVDLIRDIGKFVEKTPQIGNTKSIIIDEAESMTVSSANALLKTLEEPTDNTYIILITDDYERLLPTIISRCRLIAVKPELPNNDIDRLGSIEKPYINSSHLPDLQDKANNQPYVNFEQAFIAYVLNQKSASEMTQLFVEHTRALYWLEAIITNCLRGKYQWLSQTAENQLQLKKLEQVLNHDTLWLIYQKLIHVKKCLVSLTQANSRFVVEKLLIDIRFCVGNVEG